ncbi:fimbrial protein [Klebsiella aerogenes]
MKGHLCAGLVISLFSINSFAATVTVKGTVILPTCTIKSSSSVIQVNFGDDVITTRIDGKEYKKQKIEYSIQCDGDMSSNSGLQISISGSPASFDSSLLKTNVTGLGVRFLNGSNNLSLNSGSAKFDYINDTPPTIYAVLARDASVTLASGAFSASAMMSVDYQ